MSNAKNPLTSLQMRTLILMGVAEGAAPVNTKAVSIILGVSETQAVQTLLELCELGLANRLPHESDS